MDSGYAKRAGHVHGRLYDRAGVRRQQLHRCGPQSACRTRVIAGPASSPRYQIGMTGGHADNTGYAEGVYELGPKQESPTAWRRCSSPSATRSTRRHHQTDGQFRRARFPESAELREFGRGVARSRRRGKRHGLRDAATCPRHRRIPRCAPRRRYVDRTRLEAQRRKRSA